MRAIFKYLKASVVAYGISFSQAQALIVDKHYEEEVAFSCDNSQTCVGYFPRIPFNRTVIVQNIVCSLSYSTPLTDAHFAVFQDYGLTLRSTPIAMGTPTHVRDGDSYRYTNSMQTAFLVERSMRLYGATTVGFYFMSSGSGWIKCHISGQVVK